MSCPTMLKWILGICHSRGWEQDERFELWLRDYIVEFLTYIPRKVCNRRDMGSDLPTYNPEI